MGRASILIKEKKKNMVISIGKCVDMGYINPSMVSIFKMSLQLRKKEQGTIRVKIKAERQSRMAVFW